MTSHLYKPRVLLAKIGAGAYPTDSVPVIGTNAIQTRNLKFSPFQGKTEVIEYDRPTMGSYKEIYTGPHGKLTFDVDLVGSGTAGVEPPCDPLLRMCGFAVTVEEDESVTYSLLSAGFEYGSLYFNHEGELHKLVGCRGTAVLNMNAEASPTISFEFWGLWDQTPTTVAPGVPDFSALLDPLPVNKRNTPTWTVHGYAAFAEAATINVGWDVQYRNVVNFEGVPLVKRDGSGSMSIEKPYLADKDFFAVVRTHAIGAINIIHGLTAGNIVQIQARAQLKMKEDSESQGLAVMPLDLRLIPDEPNDELSITFT